MRHIVLALAFTVLVAALFLFAGCAKAPAEKVGEVPDNGVQVQQASDEVAALEQDLDVDEVDLDVASLFEDY